METTTHGRYHAAVGPTRLRRRMAAGAAVAGLASLTLSMAVGCDGGRTDGGATASARTAARGLGQDRFDPLPRFDPFEFVADGLGRGVAPGSAGPPGPGAPRVIWWYTIDALRADAPFASRDGQPVMPALAAFAREQAVAFEHAYANASFTKTSAACMFTGLWPQRHDVLHGVLPVWPDASTLLFDLDPRFETLAAALARQGYDTWTRPFSVHVRRGDGLLAGFRHTTLDLASDPPLPAPDGPLFVYEHVLGVHAPYAPSAEARSRLGLPPATHVDPASQDWYDAPLDDHAAGELAAAYLGEAADADARFASRLAWLRASGLWDDLLLIVTADHGEAFLEHGATRHATDLHEEMVRVPLFMRFPDGSRFAALHGRGLAQRVSLVDLAPTVRELVGAQGPAYALDGRSLLPILRGEEPDPVGRDVLLRCSEVAPRPDGGGSALFVTEAVISGPLKAIFGYRPRASQDPARHPFERGDWIAQLYDLQADPGETSDLSARRPDDFLRLMALASAASAPLAPRDGPALPSLRGTGNASGAEPVDVGSGARQDGADSRETLLELRRLGYVH